MPIFKPASAEELVRRGVAPVAPAAPEVVEVEDDLPLGKAEPEAEAEFVDADAEE